jgi:hypothetical protein
LPLLRVSPLLTRGLAHKVSNIFIRVNQRKQMKAKLIETQKARSIPFGQNLFVAFVAFLAIPFFFATTGVTKAVAQTKADGEKIIKKESFNNEPITFLSIESDGQRIETDKKFVRESEWLKDLTIKFKNNSDRPIVYVSIALVFPETQPPFGHVLKYGINPLIKLNHPDINIRQDQDPALLPVGGEASVKLSSNEFESLKRLVASKRPLSGFSEMNYRIMSVFFEDGTHWGGGSMLRPDPDRPGKFVPMDKGNKAPE